jgi:hypothetical protein
MKSASLIRSALNVDELNKVIINVNAQITIAATEILYIRAPIIASSLFSNPLHRYCAQANLFAGLQGNLHAATETGCISSATARRG